MASYSIDDLYNEGYINGEIYYLCDENGISYLEDAIPSFSEQELPNYLEALRQVYHELNKEVELQTTDYWAGWKEDCIKIAQYHFEFVHETINQFNSFVVFIKYVQSQTWLFGQYYYGGTFKDEIDKYWKSRQPDVVDDLTESWRIACKQLLSTFTPFVRKTIAALIDLYPNKESFIADLQAPSYSGEVIRIKSFGQSRKDLVEKLVPKLLNCLEAHEASSVQDSSVWDVVSQNETWLKNFYKESVKPYSVRANNALEAARKRHRSYASFFKWIQSPEFAPMSLRNVGRKTVLEINEWREYVIDSLAPKFVPSEKVSPVSNGSEAQAYPVVNANDLFNDFFRYLDSLNGARKEVACYIVKSPSVGGLTEISEKINVTRERVRQLIPSVLEGLSDFFVKKHDSRDYTKEEYLLLADNCSHQLNTEFKMWAGSFVSSEIAVVGSFEKYIYKGEPLMVVDGKLASIFDFRQFVSRIDSLKEYKYYEDTKVRIEDIILDCFVNDVQFEYLQAANRACRSILYEYYPYHLTEKEIIIPANAYYSIRQRVEDILEKEGCALTIEEIRKRLLDSGAPYDGTDNQLVSMIRKSTLVISYGYPTKFGLTTWGKPEEDAYGTIRDVAIHLLLKQSPHIMPERSLVNALLAVYTESNERSILSNLSADSKQRFGFYQKGSTMYIGLTNETYDPSYQLMVKGEVKKAASSSQKKVSWQGTFDSVKRVLSTHSWTALDDQQRKWLIKNWKKAQQGSLQEWQAIQIIELIENSKKR